MRETEFRGKPFESDEWLYSTGIDITDGGKEVKLVYGDEETSDTWYYVRPETVGQYTGLKDKNGVKIYEGDIVDIDTYSYQEPEFSGRFKVIYNEVKGMWLFVDLEDENNEYTFENINAYYITEIEIIGNIYDNPELLKESD